MRATLSYGFGNAFLTEQTVTTGMYLKQPTGDRALLTDEPSRTFDVQLSKRIMTIRLPGEEPDWLKKTLEAMHHLSGLPENWSSYGSYRIEDTAIFEAMRVLANVLGPHGVAPLVVPTSIGGIQLEWHREGEDVELEVSPQGSLSAYAYNHQTNVAWEPEEVTPETIQRIKATVNRLGRH